jgi:hypothetical protein
LKYRLHVTAIYLQTFNPKIFTDITIPDTNIYTPPIGKKAQVLTRLIFMGNLNTSEFKEPIIMTSKASQTTEVLSQAESYDGREVWLIFPLSR